MYKIHADGTLIYDSTLEDYKIGQGEITKELDKSGSFVFSLYPEHFYYDRFVKMRTVVTVRKSDKIAFRGRPLDDGADYHNLKVFTCEGELGFLQDSIIRPYSISGTPQELFTWFIQQHNSQVDEFKRFKVGTCTVVDPNGYIARENSAYESTLTNMNSRLLEDATGGHFYITHGDDGTDEMPTIHYLSDFTTVATQPIEFGVNLRDFTKKESAGDVATAIIPLGASVDDGKDNTEDKPLTIASVNGGVDYVYSKAGVALYGWIFKTVEWEDVTKPEILKAKAEAHVEESVKQALTIELTAVDMHLLDRSIESYDFCEYVPVYSPPHNFEYTLLCNTHKMNLLNPANDSVVLGETINTFTGQIGKASKDSLNIRKIQQDISKLKADMNYNEIVITGISNNVGTVEKGVNVTEMKVTWTLNKDPVSQTLGGETVDVTVRSKTVSMAGRTSVTLEVKDERDATKTASTGYNAYNGVYHGVLPDGATINSAAILSLTKKIQHSRGVTFTANCGNGARIAYAIPASGYGSPAFQDYSTKHPVDMTQVPGTVSFTNSHGYTTDYKVWLSTNVLEGSFTVAVS